MASLYFYYSSMNAGKTAALLQAAFNYEESGKNVVAFTTSLDQRFATSGVTIASRIGIQRKAESYNGKDIFGRVDSMYEIGINAVFIDEAQFLTKEQIDQCADIVDKLGIPVLCYGIRTDSNGELFEGSERLLAIADNLCEIKSICSEPNCCSKATHQIRLDDKGEVVIGEQIQIGASEYKQVCRKHFNLATKTSIV